jgi:butyryl-CoA dehydrogenase
MAAPILNERELDFLLYEFLDVEKLTQRERYQDHDKEIFNQVLATSKAIAEKHFLPIRHKVDTNEPQFDGKNVHLIPEIKPAIQAVVDAGMLSPSSDYEMGGMQLPETVANVAYSYISAVANATVGYATLTHANCNLIEAHGTPEQIEKWVHPMRAGRFYGTMAMTEPGAGSGLADLITSAEKDDDGNYRIRGNKIYISGGDHDLSENIVHLVLARLKGAPKGVKGISLFIVPKFLVNEDGSVGEHNDVSLAGLFHKMGGRGHTSAALSFGEKDGAIGYLVGEENQGLRYMFHMMNEARILVGTGAALTGLTGYQYSLYYAKERPQGRLVSNKDPLSKPVNIIEHPDVRRMLLTQKVYAEGAYALCLYGSQLSDDSKTAPDADDRAKSMLLLDFLTPIIKTWPSEYGPKANDLAIQVLGGHGYINEHPVEMFYRDNRLNPIHEGTTGIQSLDLLGRKVPMNNFAGYNAMLAEMQSTVERLGDGALAAQAEQLGAAIELLRSTTDSALKAMQEKNIDLAFANSVSYLEMFGHTVIAWIWLRQADIAQRALAQEPSEADRDFYQGKVQAMKFFYQCELPKTKHWATLVGEVNATHFDMQAEWF